MKIKPRVFVAAAFALVALVVPATGQGRSAAVSLVWKKAGVVITSYNYGTLSVGSNALASFNLKNRATSTSSTVTISLTGASAFSKVFDSCSGKRLAPLAKCTVTVSYAPTAAVNDAATLAANRLNKLPVNLGLSGAGSGGGGGGGGGGPFPTAYWVNRGDVGFNGSVNMLPAGSSTVTTLAPNQHYPVAVAVDGSNVYWINSGTTQCPSSPYCGDGSINAVPLGGGVYTTLASGLDEPNSLAVDGTNAYWTDSQHGTVNKVPLTGGSVTVLATGQNGPNSVEVDGAHVYWVEEGDPNQGNGSIKEVPIGGGTVTTLASGQHTPASLAVDATSVYWVSIGDGTVDKVPLGGGSVTTLAIGQVGVISVAVDATRVYWATQSNGSPGTGTIASVPLDGGSVTTLATGQVYPRGVTVDSSYVYWVNDAGAYGNGTVNAVPLAGGTVSVIASGQVSPQSVAVVH